MQQQSEGELEIAQRLVDHGADVNTLDAIGRPAIHFAMGTQHGAVAAYLRKKGAAPGKIVPITDLLASGDLAQGELETEKNCGLGCHSLEKNKHEHGPSLWNVVGRLKGSVKDFNYSPAFSTLGGTWTFEALNEFVARPTEVIPGIRLMEAGITDPQTRANIIAYLRTLSDNPKPLP